MAWTEDRVALLSKLWAEGLSASQIANELGEVTRNAVIGKVHRLGLSGRAKSNNSAPRARKPRTSSAPRKTTGSSGSHAPRRPQSMGATALAFDPSAEMDIEPIAHDNVVVPISKRASILTINEQVCKWPLGDPGGNDFHFCGHDSVEAGPYCQYHADIAYQPSYDRRRRRA